MPARIDIGFEGLDLTTEGIASYGDIESPEGLLIFGAVQHSLGEQDRPSTEPYAGSPAPSAAISGSRNPKIRDSLSIVVDSPPGSTIPLSPASSVVGVPAGRPRRTLSVREGARVRHLAGRGHRQRVDVSPAALGEAMWLRDVVNIDADHCLAEAAETFAITSGSS